MHHQIKQKEMKKNIVSVLCAAIMLFLTKSNSAQPQLPSKEMTLKETLQYSLEENTSIKKQNLAVIKSRFTTKEVISQGLPQINGYAQLKDNVELPTQMLPGEMMGKPGAYIPVQMGIQYSIPLSVEWNQLLYSQAYLNSIQQAKAAEDLTATQSEKTKQDVIYKVASAFYQTLITGEQMNLVHANLEQIRQSLNVVQSQYDNQMARKIDLDQLKVSLSNTQTDLDNATVAYAQYLDYLKVLMGYPIEDTLILKANVETNDFIIPQNHIDNNPSLTLLQKQENLKALEIKGIKAQYLPTLSAYAQYSYQTQFDKWSSNRDWNSSSVIGAQLSIPLFDSFQKSHQVKQSKLDLKSIQLDRAYTQNQLNTQYVNAEKKYLVNQKTVQNQQDNLNLATNIYDAVQNNYRNGISSFSDLINADSGVKAAQTQYLTALLQSKISALDILNVNGSLTELVN